MNIKEVISSATKMNGNQPEHQRWIEKPKAKLPPPPREKGVSPFYLHDHEDLSRRNRNDNKAQNNFAEIIPSVREVSGGYNVQSNEVIEKRFREQQKIYNQDIDDANSSATYTTASSATVDSYKTALQDWIPSLLDYESESSVVINKNRIKKNALIRTLVQQNEIFAVDDEDISTVSSDSFYDAPVSESDISTGIEKLNTDDDQDSMRQIRVGLWFQSAEDPDVYCHPLKDEIKKDPEWQKQRLRRKGEETVYTPRQYYFSFTEDDFGFGPPSSKSS